MVVIVSEIMFVCERQGYSECYSLVLQKKNVLYREEQVFSTSRAEGSLNPPASCLLAFSNARSLARCQAGYEKMCLTGINRTPKGIMEKAETLMG